MLYKYLDSCQATSSPAHDQQVGMLAVGLPAEKTFTGSGHAVLPGECYARFTNCRSFTRCKGGFWLLYVNRLKVQVFLSFGRTHGLSCNV